MFDDEFLLRKEAIQKKLFEDADSDWNKYAEMTDRLFKQIESEYNLKFNYQTDSSGKDH